MSGYKEVPEIVANTVFAQKQSYSQTYEYTMLCEELSVTTITRLKSAM